jgi:hypothetical protein
MVQQDKLEEGSVGVSVIEPGRDPMHIKFLYEKGGYEERAADETLDRALLLQPMMLNEMKGIQAIIKDSYNTCRSYQYILSPNNNDLYEVDYATCPDHDVSSYTQLRINVANTFKFIE